MTPSSGQSRARLDGLQRLLGSRIGEDAAA